LHELDSVTNSIDVPRDLAVKLPINFKTNCLYSWISKKRTCRIWNMYNVGLHIDLKTPTNTILRHSIKSSRIIR